MLFDVIRSLLNGQHISVVSVLAQAFSILFVIFCVLPLHEFAHGWVANKLGDPTAKLEGRLTLNPLASIDTAGAVALLFFGFGWAKPVPIDARYFKKPKRDTAIVAIAGPVSNLIAALVGAIIYIAVIVFMPANVIKQFLAAMLSYYVTVNISLAVFNLIPIPPLDGSRVIAAFLSNKALYTYYRYQNIFVMILFFLMLTGALSGPLYTVQSVFANAVMSIAQLPFKLFGVL